MIYDSALSEQWVLVSSRDSSDLNAVQSALKDLFGEKAELTWAHDVRFLPDFYLWLLWKLQTKNRVLGGNIVLEDIWEMTSRDKQLRGARFTDSATMDRIELAALILIGGANFGPAKLQLTVADPALALGFELFPGGAFTVYRGGSGYDETIDKADFGVRVAFDVWSRVLPDLRKAYDTDKAWTATGPADLAQAASALIQQILP